MHVANLNRSRTPIRERQAGVRDPPQSYDSVESSLSRHPHWHPMPQGRRGTACRCTLK